MTGKQEDLIGTILERVQSDFGKKALRLLSEESIISNVSSWTDTGSEIVNSVISGSPDGSAPVIPFGRLTEICGLNASGKTTLLGHIMARVQLQGGIVILADTEESIDKDYMTKLGIDLSKIIVLESEESETTICLEECFRKFRRLISVIKSHGADTPILLALDSLGGTVTQKERDGDEEDKHMMVGARVISYNLKRIIPVLAETKTAFICTNHMYHKPPAWPGAFPTMETPGGEKFKFFCSLRIKLKRVKDITEERPSSDTAEEIGAIVEVSVLKNKIFPRKRVAKTAIIGGHGFVDDYMVYKNLNALKKKMKDFPDIKFRGWGGFKKNIMSHEYYEELKRIYIDSLFKDRKDE